MTPTAAATGRRVERDGAGYVEYTRTFRAGAADVWAAVTEPQRLERWIGTWTGDPASGAVEFRMTAEGDDAGVETFQIDVCEPPHRLVTRSWSADDPDTVWRVEIDISEDAGTTTLTFAQAMDDPAVAENVGPGWDYYLDRLAAARAGRPLPEWEQYYPAFAPHYAQLHVPTGAHP